MQDTNVAPVRPDPPVRPGSLSQTDAIRLKKAVQEFESFLVAYMLKTMRETINRPEDERGLGRDYYESLFDSEVALSLSRTQGFWLAEAMYRQLTGEQVEDVNNIGVPVILPRPPAPTVGALPESGTHPPPSSTTVPQALSAMESVIDRVDRYAPIVHAAAQRYSLDPDLLRAVILSESNGWARAVSPKGALGLMQLMPATADTLNVEDPMDPHQNIFGGAKYLRYLLDTFAGDIRLTLASYNAGPGAVREHGGIPPYEETHTFIDRVLEYLGRFKKSK